MSLHDWSPKTGLVLDSLDIKRLTIRRKGYVQAKHNSIKTVAGKNAINCPRYTTYCVLLFVFVFFKEAGGE